MTARPSPRRSAVAPTRYRTRTRPKARGSSGRARGVRTGLRVEEARDRTRYGWHMEHAPPEVKICGITNLEDAELAVDLGAWALGMIFYEGSPRRCSLAEAQRIVARLRRRALLCGVYVNAPREEVVATSETLGLGMLQLHGEEGPAYCAEVGRRTGARIVKAAQVAGPGDLRDLERFHVDFHLLDAHSRSPGAHGLRGGTG